MIKFFVVRMKRTLIRKTTESILMNICGTLFCERKNEKKTPRDKVLSHF